MKNQNYALLGHWPAGYFHSIKRKIISFFIHSPKASLCIMATLLVCSAVLCFTLNRYPKPKSVFSYQALNSAVPDGAGLNSASLIEIFSLQSELRSFLDKKLPSKTDSLRMEQLLLRIQQLNQSLKNHEKH